MSNILLNTYIIWYDDNTIPYERNRGRRGPPPWVGPGGWGNQMEMSYRYEDRRVDISRAMVGGNRGRSGPRPALGPELGRMGGGGVHRKG